MANNLSATSENNNGKAHRLRSGDTHRRPIAVDLFAGVGGFSLGIEQAGFDVAVAVEKDPIAASVYEKNSPQTKVLCEDITMLSGQTIVETLFVERPGNTTQSEIDLVIGGPPCQGFSLMGKRRLDDDRNDLIFHFCRLVRELQPRYFVMENVPGICQGKHAIFLERLCDEFEQANYQITYPIKVLNAADFGVPQNRRRLFLLGARAGEPIREYPNPLPNLRVTVRDAIASLPNLDDFPELLKTDEVLLDAVQFDKMLAQSSSYAKRLMGIEADIGDMAIARSCDRQRLTSSLRTRHTDASTRRFKELKPGKIEPISHLRRLDWDGLSHTLRAGTDSCRGSYTSPRPIHPKYPRVISVREAARLHSFPDWFRFHPTKWHGFRQVGNAVPPLLGRSVGKQIVAALGKL